MSPARLLPLALLSPLLLAWSGGGSGDAAWSDGAGEVLPVTVSGLIETGGEVSIVLNGAVRDGEGMIFLTLPASASDRRLPVGDPSLELAYREYGPDGRLRFSADWASDGWIEFSLRSTSASVALDASWADARSPSGHRQWTVSRVRLERTGGADAPPPDRGASGGALPARDRAPYDDDPGGGCDVTVTTPEPEPYDDSSGCEGDDWGSDDDWDGDDWGDDSGGCEGDDLGGGDDWSSDSSGGCEGDDLGGGSSGAESGPSCEGDAIASAGPPRRSPTIVRLINQMPWLLVVVGLGIRRRRRR